MIKFITDLIYNKEILLNTFMGILLFLAIILFCIGSFKENNKNILKIAGLMCVVFICILSNDTVNYFLAIVIVATLITELEFLEKIVAIIRNVNDTYWKLKFETATPTEKAQKIEAEKIEAEKVEKAENEKAENEKAESEKAESEKAEGEKEEVSSRYSRNRSYIQNRMNFAAEYILFETEVMIALKKTKLFMDIQQKNIKLKLPNGHYIFFDGIAKVSPTVSLVIEVKMNTTFSVIQNAIKKLQSQVEVLCNLSNNREQRFGSIIVVPNIEGLRNRLVLSENTFILEYDQNNKAFINFSEFENWVLNYIF